MAEQQETKPKARRGFAAMDPAKQRELARQGGRAIPPEKRAFSTKPGLAAAAGRAGGKNRWRSKAEGR